MRHDLIWECRFAVVHSAESLALWLFLVLVLLYLKCCLRSSASCLCVTFEIYERRWHCACVFVSDFRCSLHVKRYLNKILLRFKRQHLTLILTQSLWCWRVEWIDCSVNRFSVKSAKNIALEKTLTILQSWLSWLCRNIFSCIALLSHLDHY